MKNIDKRTSVIPFAAHVNGVTKMKFGLRNLRADERGMSTVEYVILLAVIVVGAVGLWNQIGGKIKDKLGEAQQEIETVGAP